MGGWREGFEVQYIHVGNDREESKEERREVSGGEGEEEKLVVTRERIGGV